jgi:hypothetical protein
MIEGSLLVLNFQAIANEKLILYFSVFAPADECLLQFNCFVI